MGWGLYVWGVECVGSWVRTLKPNVEGGFKSLMMKVFVEYIAPMLQSTQRQDPESTNWSDDNKVHAITASTMSQIMTTPMPTQEPHLFTFALIQMLTRTCMRTDAVAVAMARTLTQMHKTEDL